MSVKYSVLKIGNSGHVFRSSDYSDHFLLKLIFFEPNVKIITPIHVGMVK